MDLKTAFRLQNCFNEWINSALYNLQKEENLFSKTEIHQKQGANEIIEDVFADERTIDSVELYCRFIYDLIGWKDSLTKVIRTAKQAVRYDVDGDSSVNSVRRNVSTALRRLAAKKTSRTKQKETDYTFNVEGDQISYYYPVTTTTAPRYDAKAIKKMYEDISDETEQISSGIDRCLVEDIVEFSSPFRITMTVDEAYEAWLSNQ